MRKLQHRRTAKAIDFSSGSEIVRACQTIATQVRQGLITANAIVTLESSEKL